MPNCFSLMVFAMLIAFAATQSQAGQSPGQRAPQSTGVLATAGGVVFAGALDRWFTGYDDATGKTLWRTRLNDVPNSAPITYMANGKQYVAIVVGYGGPQAASFPQLTPEIPLPVARSSSIWVFELN